MKLTSKGAKFIQEFEGLRLKAYRDQRGVWTIGYGATGPSISARTTWTKEQADERFIQDAEEREMQLTKYLGTTPTTQNQFDALMSLAYNIGMGALHGSTVLRKHLAEDYKGAADAFLSWNKVNGRVDPGLVRRRHEERDLYLEE